MTFKGDSPTIYLGLESAVQIIFDPKFGGRFDATLELIFSHGQQLTCFLVSKRLRAIVISFEDHTRFEFLDQEAAELKRSRRFFTLTE